MSDKNKVRCFIDSNVWLYAFSTNKTEDRKRLLAKQLVQPGFFASSSFLWQKLSEKPGCKGGGRL